MPAINLDFTDDDYAVVGAAAERARLPIKSYARTAVLAQSRLTPTSWTLVDRGAESIRGLSEAAKDLMKCGRGRSPEDNSYRANGCLWVHLTEPASVIAYPTAHYTSAGCFEFVLDRRGEAMLLDEWSRESTSWKAGDAPGQWAAHAMAVTIGNRRLGIPLG